MRSIKLTKNGHTIEIFESGIVYIDNNSFDVDVDFAGGTVSVSGICREDASAIVMPKSFRIRGEMMSAFAQTDCEPPFFTGWDALVFSNEACPSCIEPQYEYPIERIFSYVTEKEGFTKLEMAVFGIKKLDASIKKLGPRASVMTGFIFNVYENAVFVIDKKVMTVYQKDADMLSLATSTMKNSLYYENGLLDTHLVVSGAMSGGESSGEINLESIDREFLSSVGMISFFPTSYEEVLSAIDICRFADNATKIQIKCTSQYTDARAMYNITIEKGASGIEVKIVRQTLSENDREMFDTICHVVNSLFVPNFTSINFNLDGEDINVGSVANIKNTPLFRGVVSNGKVLTSWGNNISKFTTSCDVYEDSPSMFKKFENSDNGLIRTNYDFNSGTITIPINPNTKKRTAYVDEGEIATHTLLIQGGVFMLNSKSGYVSRIQAPSFGDSGKVGMEIENRFFEADGQNLINKVDFYTGYALKGDAYVSGFPDNLWDYVLSSEGTSIAEVIDMNYHYQKGGFIRRSTEGKEGINSGVQTSFKSSRADVYETSVLDGSATVHRNTRIVTVPTQGPVYGTRMVSYDGTVSHYDFVIGGETAFSVLENFFALKNVTEYCGVNIENGFIPEMIERTLPNNAGTTLSRIFRGDIDFIENDNSDYDFMVFKEGIEDFSIYHRLKDGDKSFLDAVKEAMVFYNEEVYQKNVILSDTPFFNILAEMEFYVYSKKYSITHPDTEAISSNGNIIVYEGVYISNAKMVAGDYVVFDDYTETIEELGSVLIENNQDGTYSFVSTVAPISAQKVKVTLGLIYDEVQKFHKRTISRGEPIVKEIPEETASFVDYSISTKEDGEIEIVWVDNSTITPKFVTINDKKVLIGEE